jgi:hypothetical protein
VTLEKTFWKQRAKIQAGVYSGQGEYILSAVTGGDGDPSARPEFVGRAEVSWPGRYRYNEVFDTRHVPYPMVSIGANGRYTNRTSSIKGITDFDLKFVQGKKYTYGLDIAAQYMGFSALFEIHQLKIFPTGQDTNFLRARQTTYFRAGGYIAQLAYYSKRIKSGFFSALRQSCAQRFNSQLLGFKREFLLRLYGKRNQIHVACAIHKTNRSR